MRNIALNAMSLSVARVLNPLTSILLVSAVARTQGAAGLGEYSLVLTIFYMAAGLAGLGLATPITRAVAVDKEQASDFFTVTSCVGVISGIAAIGVIQFLVSVLGYSDSLQNSSQLLMWAVIPSVLISHYDAIFMAFHRAPVIAAMSIIENTGKVIVSLILLARGHDMSAVFAVIVFFRIMVAVFYIIYFRIRISPIILRFDFGTLSLLWFASPIFTTNLVASTLLGRIDLILLSKLGSLAEVGYYSAALRLISIASLIPFSLKRAVLPAMCETFFKNTSACRILFDQSIKYMAVFGFGAALALYALAGFMISFVFGSDLAPGVKPLQIMALYLIPASVTPLLSCLLISATQEKLDLLCNFAKIAILTATCTVLIPYWGQVGAAVALVVAEIGLLAFMVFFIEQRIFGVHLGSKMVRPLAAAIAACGVLYLSSGINPLISGVLALVLYSILILSIDSQLRQDISRSLVNTSRVLKNKKNKLP